MMSAFAWIEQTAPSLFMREDFSAYFVALIFHAWGMALLVGGGVAIALRGVGVASSAPVARFRGFFPVMWVGAAMAVPSGLALLVGYPAKALTNPVFGLKFVCLIGAALLVARIPRAAEPLSARTRWIGAAALLLWAGGVACGKLLLYTNRMLLVS